MESITRFSNQSGAQKAIYVLDTFRPELTWEAGQVFSADVPGRMDVDPRCPETEMAMIYKWHRAGRIDEAELKWREIFHRELITMSPEERSAKWVVETLVDFFKNPMVVGTAEDFERDAREILALSRAELAEQGVEL